MQWTSAPFITDSYADSSASVLPANSDPRLEQFCRRRKTAHSSHRRASFRLNYLGTNHCVSGFHTIFFSSQMCRNITGILQSTIMLLFNTVYNVSSTVCEQCLHNIPVSPWVKTAAISPLACINYKPL